MLPFYAARLDTVEINYTFYRTPTAKVMEGWAEAVPERFKFTLKAPKRITHIARLQGLPGAPAILRQDRRRLSGPSSAFFFFSFRRT